MAKFTFRLLTLLKLREAARDERRAALAAAYRAEEILASRINNVERALSKLKNDNAKAVSPGPLDIDRLMDAQRYELVLAAEKAALEQQHRSLAVETENRRLALVAADREVQILEKLRERQAARHSREEHRRETKELDEIAGCRAYRDSEADRAEQNSQYEAGGRKTVEAGLGP